MCNAWLLLLVFPACWLGTGKLFAFVEQQFPARRDEPRSRGSTGEDSAQDDSGRRIKDEAGATSAIRSRIHWTKTGVASVTSNWKQRDLAGKTIQKVYDTKQRNNTHTPRWTEKNCKWSDTKKKGRRLVSGIFVAFLGSLRAARHKLVTCISLFVFGECGIFLIKVREHSVFAHEWNPGEKSHEWSWAEMLRVIYAASFSSIVALIIWLRKLGAFMVARHAEMQMESRRKLDTCVRG